MNADPVFKKLILVGNYEPDRQQSMLRFTSMLADGFAARGIEVETWRPSPRFGKLSPGGYRYGGLPKYLGYLDKFVCFPRELSRRARTQPPGTVFHITDHSNAVYLPRLAAAPALVTVNDLLQIRSALGEFPQNRLSRPGMRYQRWILAHLSCARPVACISEKTRDDLLRLAPGAAGAAGVVEMGLNYPYRPLPPGEAEPLLARAFGRHGAPPPREPYFIHVGGAQWYKNRAGLIELFAELRKIPATARHKLLHVGPPFEAAEQVLIERHALGDAIIRLDALTNAELNAAYSLAGALIFPSWEEGFGWPVAEAQACGCPVFASNRAPMTEVGGDAAIYFDPAAPPAETAALIAKTLSVSKNKLRAAGLARATRWDPARMLDAYGQLYRETLARFHARQSS